MATTEDYGTHEGQPVQAVTLHNANGLRARLVTFGARLTELHVPDRHGSLADIVLGCDSLADYAATATYFGATCGRYGNRIAGGQVTLDGKPVQLDRNEGPNHLHGGRAGFDRKVWAVGALTDTAVTFTALSDDGEMGFPGACNLRATYALTDDNRLTITMQADTTRTTLMNMVHHSYFNLAGHSSGDVLAQQVRLAGRFYTPVDAALLATGEIRAVAGTPFDFTALRTIGQDHAAYDHNWCLDPAPTGLRLCAEAHDPASGRSMTLHTTEPGVQFYTGGYLEGKPGKGGQRLCRYAGFTLETQKFPGTPQFGHFPSCTLRHGETYHHEMVFHFGTDADRN